MANTQDLHQVIEEQIGNKEFPCYTCGLPTNNFDVMKRISSKNKALLIEFVSLCPDCQKKESEE